MYALVHKNKILVGPKDWDRGFFLAALREKGIKNAIIPRKPQEQLPYAIDEDTKIFKAEVVKAEINPMVEYHRGPIWTITEETATANYEAVDTPVEYARGNFKALAASERYKKEIAGTTFEIQGVTVTLDTTREGRNIFIQKYSMMGDLDTVNWKFPEGWLTLNKSELGQVIAAGAAHIQTAFDWEKGISDLIDSAQTKEELLAIEIVEKAEDNNPQIENE